MNGATPCLEVPGCPSPSSTRVTCPRPPGRQHSWVTPHLKHEQLALQGLRALLSQRVVHGCCGYCTLSTLTGGQKFSSSLSVLRNPAQDPALLAFSGRAGPPGHHWEMNFNLQSQGQKNNFKNIDKSRGLEGPQCQGKNELHQEHRIKIQLHLFALERITHCNR